MTKFEADTKMRDIVLETRRDVESIKFYRENGHTAACAKRMVFEGKNCNCGVKEKTE